MIAALYVETDGCYYGLGGVDPWDEGRDARAYAGPYPVVAHPPCQRWGKFWAGQPLWIKRTGQRKKKGDDNGCFEAALASARKFGGVIEHPADSHAWAHFRLNKPPRTGGWVKADDFGGWTCCVEQGRYGHYARKPTWLVVYGITENDLPELRWGKSERRLDPKVVERMGLERAKRLGEVGSRGGGTDSAPRIGTPPEFRDLLIQIASLATKENENMEKLFEIPSDSDLKGARAKVSFLPGYSGDGYGYGGGAILCVGEHAIPFGEGQRAAFLAEALATLWNASQP